MQTRTGDWIEVYSGTKFYPLDPKPEEILIEDIAHSLSNMCRFAGHCRVFYSVAEHSVRTSWAVPTEHALWALLHDASEAYLVDIPRPLKHYSNLGEIYRQIEQPLQQMIYERFGLSGPEPSSVKTADNLLLSTEHRDLINSQQIWSGLPEPMASKIVPWSSEQARMEFLMRFSQLTKSH